MRKSKNTLVALIFINILLAVALLIALAYGLFANSSRPPGADAEPEDAMLVDAAPIMAYASDYNVSTEYLQLVLPGYLVYRDGTEYVFQPIDYRLPQHDYDWLLLTYDDDRIYYQDPDYGRVSYGIDVSTFQGEIDWPAVKADGIDFAIIRAGYRGYGEAGSIVEDERFAVNIAEAIAAGLEVGVYFFSQAVTEEEAEEEAELVLSLIDGYQLTYPVVFDMEEIYGDTARTDHLDREAATDIARAFCRKIKKAGYQPMIYGNIKWLAGKVDLSELTDYDLWLAQYYEHPLFPYAFRMWQYSNTGSVAGIAGDVDLNICFTAYE